MKTGVKGNTQAHQVGREVNRELKRAEPQSDRTRVDDTQDSIVKSNPWAGSASRQVEKASSMGMGKDRIASDHRKDCLITDKNPTLDHHGDRMDEHGGFRPDTEMGKMKQGNIMPTDKNFKTNPNGSVS